MVLDGRPGLYGLKYYNATACGLPFYLCSYKLVGSATSVEARGGRVAKGGCRSALHSTTLASNDDGWLPMVVVEVAHGETWPVSQLVKLQVYDNGPMDPWPLHHDR